MTEVVCLSSLLVSAFNILAISGSLRRDSLNTRLLQAAVEVAPVDTRINIIGGPTDLPILNGDLGMVDSPLPVLEMRDRISAADALLIATPEYNYAIPGGLKNALDWASLPPGRHCLRGKPVTVMGASMGNFGTVRSQLALRQVWLWTDAIPVTKPEVHVFRAHERFEEQRNLIDVGTHALISDLLDSLRGIAESRATVGVR